MIHYELLKQSPKLLLHAQLKPSQGDRFQPTGFADLGAAEYTKPDLDGKSGIKMLLVESAQSVANRLERTCLDGDGPDIEEGLKGLPYIAATLEGSELKSSIRTSSLTEAHRLASPYFLKSQFGKELEKELDYDSKGPMNWKKIYSTLFKYDPNCLLHGVFLSLLGDGRIRVARAVTGFIEAENVKSVVSGGVKNSQVDPTGQIQVVTDGKAGEKGIYSNVPYGRVEYVAASITAYFNLDLSLIRGYGFSLEATNLLIVLALLKIRRFLTAHLRLRTACSLELIGEVHCDQPSTFVLPEESELLSEAQRLIGQCKDLFANPPVKELMVKVKLEKTKESAKGKGESKQTDNSEGEEES